MAVKLRELICFLAVVVLCAQLPMWASAQRGATMARTTATTYVLHDIQDSDITIKTLEQYLDAVGSADVLDGFTITKNVGAGTIDVTGGHAILRNSVTAGPDSRMKIFHVNAVEDVAIDDLTSTYLYVDWNNGSPTISTTADPSSINNTTKVAFGWVFRNGTTYMDVFQAGPTTIDFVSRWVTRAFDVDAVKRSFGSRLSAPSGWTIKSSAGSFYSVLAPAATEAVDTSIPTGSFTTVFRSAADAWTRTTGQLVINQAKFNNLATNTLDDISPSSKFGVGWWYWIFDNPSRLMFVYGQDQYAHASEARAAAALPPATVPPELEAPAVSFLAGSVYWQASGSTFAEVLNREDVTFVSTVGISHNDLANIQGGTPGEYYHHTAQRFNDLTGVSKETILNNQATPVDLGTRLYPPASYRGFLMTGQLAIDADTDVFRSIEVWAIWNGSSYSVTQTDVGGAAVVTFSVTAAGQIQYVSNNFAGFVSGSFSLDVKPFAL